MKDPSPITARPPSPAADPKALLAAANSASEKVAALHIVFLALCAYVLVIVFGTTDLNLLIGRGVKLPVVDVEVPIVGFYAMAPFLLVVVHFNLFLSLQLLSRKLYAFDDAAQANEDVGGLHDQLNIFPYNHYLVGRTGRVMERFLALVVIITMLLLPLAALLTLQARFLAYQSEAVTWAQRAATWLDVALVVIFWPIIIDRGDSWTAFVKRVWDDVKQRWLRWAWRLVGLTLAVTLLVSSNESLYMWSSALAVWLLVTVFVPAWRRLFRWLSRGYYFTGSQATPFVAGATGLVTVLLLGLPLPLVLLVDGETLDSPKAIGTKILNRLRLRQLDLQEEILLAKPARPEIIADLRSSDAPKREAAQRSIERINLQGRSLRGAIFSRVLMPLGDLRNAQLQGAIFTQAQLQGAIFVKAELQGADLEQAQLQGANFFAAQLQGTKLLSAQLQGAYLEFAQLQGANLVSAKLSGANLGRAELQMADLGNTELQGVELMGAQLQGADLSYARLQAANLSYAQLQGTNLQWTRLDGANLNEAQLQGANLLEANLLAVNLTNATLYLKPTRGITRLLDVQGLKWQPLGTKGVEQLKKIANQPAWNNKMKARLLNDLDIAITIATDSLKPLMFESCFPNAKTEIACEKTYELGEFREKLVEELEKIACESSYTAHAIVARLPKEVRSVTKGLAQRLQDRHKRRSEQSLCPGLFFLTEEDAKLLTLMAQYEQRS